MSRISHIVPEKKDIDRVLNFKNSGKQTREDVPFVSKAGPQARAITDRNKLVRRAKAVAGIWGTRDHTGVYKGRQVTVNVWLPFAERLDELGFSVREIHEISEYEHENAVEAMGLQEMFI